MRVMRAENTPVARVLPAGGVRGDPLARRAIDHGSRASRRQVVVLPDRGRRQDRVRGGPAAAEPAPASCWPGPPRRVQPALRPAPADAARAAIGLVAVACSRPVCWRAGWPRRCAALREAAAPAGVGRAVGAASSREGPREVAQVADSVNDAGRGAGDQRGQAAGVPAVGLARAAHAADGDQAASVSRWPTGSAPARPPPRPAGPSSPSRAGWSGWSATCSTWPGWAPTTSGSTRSRSTWSTWCPRRPASGRPAVRRPACRSRPSCRAARCRPSPTGPGCGRSSTGWPRTRCGSPRPAGRSCWLCRTDRGQRPSIEVRDGGPGLTADDLTVAFDRSALYERYRGVRQVGTGLGLALVKAWPPASLAPRRPATRPRAAPASGFGSRSPDYGDSRCRSRGNSVTWRTFSASIRRETNRSSPIAKPPCGGIPCRNASR